MKASCHPDRVLIAGGLCTPCWATRYPDKRGNKLAEQALYDMISEKQGGVCAICGVAATIGAQCRVSPRRDWGPPLDMDHNHRTGQRRGLLCGGCNTALGLFGDDPDRLEKAAVYLREADIETWLYD